MTYGSPRVRDLFHQRKTPSRCAETVWLFRNRFAWRRSVGDKRLVGGVNTNVKVAVKQWVRSSRMVRGAHVA